MRIGLLVLSWIGRQKARAVAVLVVIGLALPDLGTVLRPFVAEAVAGLLFVAFLRIDPAGFRSLLRRPGLVVFGSAWSMLGVPLLFVSACFLAGIDRSNPSLFTGLMLQSIASPMVAAPALAALMGLDATLVLATLIVSSIAVPVTAPLISGLIGLDLTFSPLMLGLKLAAIIAGAAVFGLLARRFVGVARIDRYGSEIDGLNILILFIFIAAIMGDVGVRFLAQPTLVAGLTVLAFAVFATLFVVTLLVFRFAGNQQAMALAMMTSQKNMGLMLAATGGLLPDMTWLYFAVGQFPIYLSPLLLGPVSRSVAKDGE